MSIIGKRPRILRKSQSIRSMVNETFLYPSDFIYPMFVIDGSDQVQPVESMPDVYRYNLEDLYRKAEECLELGIRAIALFPCIRSNLKDSIGTEALRRESLIYRVIAGLKERFPDLLLFADVALDPYTDHGHDGLLGEDGKTVLNDQTVEVLCAMSVMMAQAGVDFVAPSDMMDGRIGAIRNALEETGHHDTGILSYTAKFASAFYGPFRDALGSKQGQDQICKASYQLNPANRRESLIEMKLDQNEGSDILMVKPAGPYLDIIRDIRERTDVPIAAYQVSGEYSQIYAAAQKGWLDLSRTRRESLLSIKRAGADMILSYFAISFCKEENFHS